MAFITIEDLTGSIEALVFPKTYKDVKAYIHEDSIVKIDGRLSYREEEEPKLLCNNIVRLSDLSKEPVKKEDAAASEKLYLKFSLGKDFLLEKVKGLLSLYKGDTPVYVHIEETKQTALAPKEFFVKADEYLIKSLTDILGKENVVLKK